MDLTSVSQFDSCYAEFKPLTPTPADQLKKKLEQDDKILIEKDLVKNLGLESIKSEYLDMTRYYFSKEMNKIFGFSQTTAVAQVSKEIDSHLRELNKLPLAE